MIRDNSFVGFFAINFNGVYMALTIKDYEDAMAVQSACNLSGVVYSFARVMDKICEDTDSGTKERNTHPICRLYAEQIMHLTCGGVGDNLSYRAAYMEVADIIEKVKQEGKA